MRLLGGRFQFESNSPQLMQLVNSAYKGLPSHRLTEASPRLTVKLVLGPGAGPRRFGTEPPPLSMLSGAGLVGTATAMSSSVIVLPQELAALVTVSPQMLRYPYHTRYEMIEFAVFTLATRSQLLVPLHGACVGLGRRGVLLMGPSGAGKSTVALQCLLAGFHFVSEDAVFVEPRRMKATGVANYLHVRAETLQWFDPIRVGDVIRRSPVIRRRSGVKKFELDLRRGAYSLAPRPLDVAAVVLLSPQSARGSSLVQRLAVADLGTRLAASQPYAANQPGWNPFVKAVAKLGVFELRRGKHPRDAVGALREILAGDF